MTQYKIYCITIYLVLEFHVSIQTSGSWEKWKLHSFFSGREIILVFLKIRLEILINKLINAVFMQKNSNKSRIIIEISLFTAEVILISHFELQKQKQTKRKCATSMPRWNAT